MPLFFLSLSFLCINDLELCSLFALEKELENALSNEKLYQVLPKIFFLVLALNYSFDFKVHRASMKYL